MLSILESLANYGVIDIFFGVGILAFIQRRLRRKTVDEIDGVLIMPSVSARDGFLELRIKNDSRDILYLYRAVFKPGYFVNAVDRSSIGALARSLMWMTWKNDVLPRVTEPSRTTNGDFILQGLNEDSKEVDALFLEPRTAGSYVLGIEYSGIDDDPRTWDAVFESRRCGRFKAHFVHGQTAGLVEVQI